MEATEVNISNGLESVAVSVGIGNQFIETSAAMEPTVVSNSEFCSDVVVASSKNKKQSNPRGRHLQDIFVHPSGVQVPASNPGVSNCYVFKSRLQEYAQKVGLSTPVYETIKEGPSHEPSFRSAVIVDGERYESLPGFFNRKAAEQSAAEVALVEIFKRAQIQNSITLPVHETGLCKNLLQEYAQKMNYAIPTYNCRKDDTPGRTFLFSCTVDIGGIQYIGAAANTKKQAEIKAARTALLAIQSSDAVRNKIDSGPQYSVVPGKRKMPESAPPKVETVKAKKRKKPRFKKKKRNPGETQAGILGNLASNDMSAPIAYQVPNLGLMHANTSSSDLNNLLLKNNQLNGEAYAVIGVICDSGPQVGIVDSSQMDEHRNPSADSSVPLADANKIQQENNNQGVGELESLPLDSCLKSEDPANQLEGDKSTSAL